MNRGASEIVSEYHHRPSPHFVFDEVTWANAKTNLGARADASIAGQIGWATGIPVYLNECPTLWNCKGGADHD